MCLGWALRLFSKRQYAIIITETMGLARKPESAAVPQQRFKSSYRTCRDHNTDLTQTLIAGGAGRWSWYGLRVQFHRFLLREDLRDAAQKVHHVGWRYSCQNKVLHDVEISLICLNFVKKLCTYLEHLWRLLLGCTSLDNMIYCIYYHYGTSPTTVILCWQV